MRHGFTLIETVIYTALLVSGMAVLTTILLSGLNTRSLITGEQQLVSNQQLAELTIVERLGQAGAVITPASATSTQLVINSPTPSDDPVTFQVTDGVMTMTLGLQAPVALTSDAVRVSAFTVTRLTATPPSVRIAVTYETDTASGATPRIDSAFTYTLRHE
ncbi:hypothetical protein EPO33_01700 [Patescibacteria group bacterium]|nr:MAG: hypothetical protein EPO33_01700 [Patescibacteria group bacterium]